MQNRPIGILDSGLGGLSVLREIHALLPHESLHYVGDSAWCPYGPKPVEDIRARVFAITDHLLARGAKMIVVACNSATIAAVESLRAAYPLPFTGMEPAVKPAAALTKSGTIGVLATEASLAGEKYLHLVNAHARDLRLITRPCPEFVDLVEAGILDGIEARHAVNLHLMPLLNEGADVIVLGCTHYPFLRPIIEQLTGPDVAVIDTGAAVARQVKRRLEQDHLLAPEQGVPTLRITTTGSPEILHKIFPSLCPGIVAELGQAEDLD
jgi:glutamate racemase